MLDKNLDITSYERNIQVLMPELFKTMNNLAIQLWIICKQYYIVYNINPCVNNFNIRDLQEFAAERKKTVKYGLETVSYRCPQLWLFMPDTIKPTS